MSDKIQKSKPKQSMGVRIIKSHEPVIKADVATNIKESSARSADEWVQKPFSMQGQERMVEHSTIIPQCIRAYKNNIAGFGIGVRYKEDFEQETADMKREFDGMTQVLQLLNMDKDTKEVFEETIAARETFGIAYQEVIRDLQGNPVEIVHVESTEAVEKSKPLAPYVEIEHCYNGEKFKRRKKFCKYRQQVGGETVHFKEIGDPRIMDNRTGEYWSEGEEIPFEHSANEVIEYKTGGGTYGKVRWIGQALGVDGSRKAEELNNRYFEDGRHTPLLMMIKNGTLTDGSYEKLQTYMDGIKGAAGQHSFMVLEMENGENETGFENGSQPEIEIKDLAAILQKDELFQEYLDNSRRRIQSAFQLPDLYVAYTTDFNRATAQTAMEVTEKQVFQPERKSLAWIINNKLLSHYGFKYVEAYFLEPQMSNPDDLSKILNITERAGGLTPNKAKEITFSMLGGEAENYEGEWGETPLALAKSTAPTPTAEQQPVAKAADDAPILAVLKEVRSLLEEET